MVPYRYLVNPIQFKGRYRYDKIAECLFFLVMVFRSYYWYRYQVLPYR
jgi:hypothetical protein